MLIIRYGPPKEIVLVGRLSLWLSVWLSENEFTLVEKNQRLSILSWPQWYFGVSEFLKKYILF
jgi:hypothetical protein